MTVGSIFSLVNIGMYCISSCIGMRTLAEWRPHAHTHTHSQTSHELLASVFVSSKIHCMHAVFVCGVLPPLRNISTLYFEWWTNERDRNWKYEMLNRIKIGMRPHAVRQIKIRKKNLGCKWKSRRCRRRLGCNMSIVSASSMWKILLPRVIQLNLLKPGLVAWSLLLLLPLSLLSSSTFFASRWIQRFEWIASFYNAYVFSAAQFSCSSIYWNVRVFVGLALLSSVHADSSSLASCVSMLVRACVCVCAPFSMLVCYFCIGEAPLCSHTSLGCFASLALYVFASSMPQFESRAPVALL